MAFRKTFVISDESVNCYGFWIRTQGIKLDNARKNCPAYFNHETWGIPLGHWENLRVDDNSQLLGDLVIEGANDIEKEYIRKIENGDIKGCSGGFDPLNWSTDAINIKDGQSAAALWECELFEASLAPLNGNKNALALRGKDGLITLSDSNRNNIIPDLNPQFDMKQIALKLGLSETATEQQIIEAIVNLQSNATSAETMRKLIEETASEGLSDEHKALFVELSKTNITAAMQFVKLSKATPAAVEAPAAAAAGAGVKKDVKVSDLIQKQNLSKERAADGKDTFDYLQKKNPVELRRIRTEEPEKYQELVSEYGTGVRYTGK